MGNALLNLIEELKTLPIDRLIDSINVVKMALHEISPMRSEPVDCVIWVKNDKVIANDYNPNKVAPPEMELLGISISEDGYTQPIVVYPEEENYTVIDGFHRHRVGKEFTEITERVHNRLPVTVINEDREEKADRIASTIRHNRARGKHQIEAMSDIVVELSKRNWSDKKIGKELGMDADEVLRLKQITGLSELFENEEFSDGWE